MSDVTIHYTGADRVQGLSQSVDVYPFMPSFEARVGGVSYLRVWVQLTGLTAEVLRHRLEEAGLTPADDVLHRTLLRYGVRRLEATVQELLTAGEAPPAQVDVWTLGTEDVRELEALAARKHCEYEHREHRDVFCLVPAGSGPREQIGDRSAAPVSRAACRGCELPDTDHLCSLFLHPRVEESFSSPNRRTVSSATCDHDRPEIRNKSGCRPGANPCWQRTVELPPPAHTPASPLALAEAFDSLDAMWRLAFGRRKRLVTIGTASSAAGLALPCTSRSDFDSRLTALADVIDRLNVAEDLLSAEQLEAARGTLDKIEYVIKEKLSVEQQPRAVKILQTIRQVRQVRNALQHGNAQDGGVTGRLRAMGIHDAPPNWSGAWEVIRSRTAAAVGELRDELRVYVDSDS